MYLITIPHLGLDSLCRDAHMNSQRTSCNNYFAHGGPAINILMQRMLGGSDSTLTEETNGSGYIVS